MYKPFGVLITMHLRVMFHLQVIEVVWEASMTFCVFETLKCTNNNTLYSSSAFWGHGSSLSSTKTSKYLAKSLEEYIRSCTVVAAMRSTCSGETPGCRGRHCEWW